MRSILFAVLLLSTLPVAFGTIDSPLFSVKQESHNSIIHLTGTNTAQSPILAYVVVAEIGRSRKTWKRVCNTGEVRCSPSFGPKYSLLKVDRCLQYSIDTSLLLGLWEL